MLAKIAKIANRLDSLGLTKEADILDAYLLKTAGEETSGPQGTNAPASEGIPLGPISVGTVSVPSSSPSLGAPLAVSAPKAPAASGTPLDADALGQAAYNLIRDKYIHKFTNILNRLRKADPDASFSATFSFKINKDGSVDPASIKVACEPDIKSSWTDQSGVHPTLLSDDLKTEIKTWKFPPGVEPILYEHPKAVSGIHFGKIAP
jgi:hypothetical protein